MHHICDMMPKMSVSLSVTKISWLFICVCRSLTGLYFSACFLLSFLCVVSMTKPCYKSSLQLRLNQQRVLFEHLSGLPIFVLPIRREQYVSNSQGEFSVGKVLARQYTSVIMFQHHLAGNSLCSLLLIRDIPCTMHLWFLVINMYESR